MLKIFFEFLYPLYSECNQSDSNKSYIQKQSKIGRIVTKDLNKIAAIENFEKKNEKKDTFPTFFLDFGLKKVAKNCMLCVKSYLYAH